jgi:hypothetical protein
MRVGGQLHAPAALPPGQSPGSHCIGGWMDKVISRYVFFDKDLRIYSESARLSRLTDGCY